MLKKNNLHAWLIAAVLLVAVLGCIITTNILRAHHYVGYWQCWHEKDLVLQINEDFTCSLHSRDSLDGIHREEENSGVWSWWPPDWPQAQMSELPTELQNKDGIVLSLGSSSQPTDPIRITANLTWNGHLTMTTRLDTDHPITYVFRKSK